MAPLKNFLAAMCNLHCNCTCNIYKREQERQQLGNWATGQEGKRARMTGSMIRPLVQAVLEPLLVVVDDLTEQFMYPRGLTVEPSVLLARDEPLSSKYIVRDTMYKFGHPVVFELVALRIKISKLQLLSDAEYRDTTSQEFLESNAQRRLVDIERITRHIYVRLLHEKKLESLLPRSHVCHEALVTNEPHLKQLIKLFDQLDLLISTHTDSTQFCKECHDIYKQSVCDSRGYHEYNDTHQHTDTSSLPCDNPQMKQFLDSRKQLLHITTRRIF